MQSKLWTEEEKTIKNYRAFSFLQKILYAYEKK